MQRTYSLIRFHSSWIYKRPFAVTALPLNHSAAFPLTVAKILQLDPTIPVVTSDGEGEAIGWIDYSKDDDLMWIVFLKKNGECWIYPNSKIRACPNISVGRMANVKASDLIAQISPQVPPTHETKVPV